MSAHSESRPDAGPETSVPLDDADEGMDAAEAAGFGGITWADELEGDDGSAKADSSSSSAEESAQGGVSPGEGPENHEGGAPDSTTIDDQNSATSGAEPGTGGEPTGPAATPDSGSNGAISVEALVQDLERVTAERDQYLDASRRLQAEFENYRKAVAKREVEARERANESLVNEILPVLDACDGAVANGATDVELVRTSLIDALTKQGLERIDDEASAFDPARHEAVMHEPEDGGAGPVVAEIMRAGYSWKGRVVRPAMVRVRG